MVNIQHHWEYSGGSLVGFSNHDLVVFASIEAQGFVELFASNVSDIHGGKHCQQEEAAPKPGGEAPHGVWLSLHQGIKEIAVAVLVLAPILEKVKDRKDLAFWILL